MYFNYYLIILFFLIIFLDYYQGIPKNPVVPTSWYSMLIRGR